MTTCHFRHAAVTGTAVLALLLTVNAAASEADGMSAVMLTRGNGATICTIGTSIEGKVVVDNDRTAVLHAPSFQAWHGRGNVTKYAEVRRDVGGLFEAMQLGRCTIVVESTSRIAALTHELEEDGMIFSSLPTPLRGTQLADAYAYSLGFESDEELQLAAYMLATREELQTFFRLGIRTRSAYDDAVLRMREQGYDQDPLQLLVFLKDEAEGLRRNLTAAAIREERTARVQ